MTSNMYIVYPSGSINTSSSVTKKLVLGYEVFKRVYTLHVER